ncbi:hypothetical protein V6N13_086517 [Hibiscus sabdariffa]
MKIIFIRIQLKDYSSALSENIKISDPLEEGCKLDPIVSKGQHLEKGYYVEPTIITDVNTSMQIWREVFGPVLCIKTFTTEDEAIELTNDTIRVWEVLCGSIVHNHPCFCQAPFGGVKWSGFGRELGEWGLENHWSVKQVREYVSDEQWGWYEPPKQ